MVTSEGRGWNWQQGAAEAHLCVINKLPHVLPDLALTSCQCVWFDVFAILIAKLDFLFACIRA
eukprot:6204876-Pleurochrysis_carterae.AAC.1